MQNLILAKGNALDFIEEKIRCRGQFNNGHFPKETTVSGLVQDLCKRFGTNPLQNVYVSEIVEDLLYETIYQRFTEKEICVLGNTILILTPTDRALAKIKEMSGGAVSVEYAPFRKTFGQMSWIDCLAETSDVDPRPLRGWHKSATDYVMSRKDMALSIETKRLKWRVYLDNGHVEFEELKKGRKIRERLFAAKGKCRVLMLEI